MKKEHPDKRPVRDWFGLMIAILQFITAVVNAVFNYWARHASQMDPSLRVEARTLGFQSFA
jgi:hypothetical protein